MRPPRADDPAPEHGVSAGSAEVAPSPLAPPRPDLLAGPPDHSAKAAARVAQRHHEQPRLAVAVGARHARQRALAVVDLGFLARQEFEPIELLGLAGAQLAHEALDAVVGAVKAVLIDQVLPDGRGVAPSAQLLLDERSVRLARGDRADGRRRRWPGWRNLGRRAGGHPGGIRLLSGQALLVPNSPLREGDESSALPRTGRGSPDEPFSSSRPLAQVEEFAWPKVGEFGWPSGIETTDVMERWRGAQRVG